MQDYKNVAYTLTAAGEIQFEIFILRRPLVDLKRPHQTYMLKTWGHTFHGGTRYAWRARSHGQTHDK